MRFDIITIFPQILDSYFSFAQIKRAKEKGLIDIALHDLRDFTKDKHRTTDDAPYGGGAGMVMKVEPIEKCIAEVLKQSPFPREEIKIILLSAKGKIFTQKKSSELSKKYKQIIFICGRYEGVDERVAKHVADEEISLGKFVLSGGELGAALVLDSVTRLLPEVLGNKESLLEESYNTQEIEYPQYTRPEVFKGWKVPKALLSGDPKEINKWRKGKQR